MGAHGSKNHRGPPYYGHQHYQSVHNNARLAKQNGNHNMSFDSETTFPNKPPSLLNESQPKHNGQVPQFTQVMSQNNRADLRRQYQAMMRQRPQLNYASPPNEMQVVGNSRAGSTTAVFQPTRTLRPILTPQSTQLDAASTLHRNNERYSSSTNYRPSSVDRSNNVGTLPKQVQFSANKAGGNRVTFGSTSAIAVANDNDAGGRAETNGVFTRSKDSHHASQLAINVTYNKPENGAGGINKNMASGAMTLDRRTLASSSSNRVPTRSNTLRKQVLGVNSIARYRSDPALADENNSPNSNTATLPRGGLQIVGQHDDRFNVVANDEDDDDDDEQPRQQIMTVVIGDSDGDSAIRPKLRVIRQPQPRRLAGANNGSGGSITELSDIVAANSADSGVELKPELFSLLSESSPNNSSNNSAAQPSPLPMVQRHQSLPRHITTLTTSKTKPVTINNNNNNNTLERNGKSDDYLIPPCNCEDCRHPINRNRNSTTCFISQQNFRPRPRPLPPDPPRSLVEPDDNNNYYYNEDCSYEGCCCHNNSKDESDYQRLVHRSYKGQPPTLRRGTVLPPKQGKRAIVPDDDIYTTAFSGEATLLRQKPKSTKNTRAPDPPVNRNRRGSSMYVVSTSSSPSEKENGRSNVATFLAKEKNGALVIVNRVDLEIGLLNGKYVQYDIAPPILLDQAAKQVELLSQPVTEPTSLLMTCSDGGNNAETMSNSHYDSGVSPADSSSGGGGGSSGNGSGDSSSNDSSPPPPLLPPRQRGPPSVSSSQHFVMRRKLEEQHLMRSNITMHIEAAVDRSSPDSNNGCNNNNSSSNNNNNNVDATLHELTCILPPATDEIVEQA